MSLRVVVTCQQMQDCIDQFRARFAEHDIELVLPELSGQQFSEPELIALLADAHGIIAGDDPISGAVLDHAPLLRTIAKWGIGIDGIDTEEAARRGITVTNTPGVFGDDVADLAIGYVVALARQLHRIHASVVDGGWLKVRGHALSGATLGVAGFGSIGQAVARRGTAMGMRITAHDVTDSARHAADDVGVPLVDRDALFATSRFVVLCMPLTPETRHFVNKTTLALMTPGSYLVNVARGSLVDEPALVDALRTGRLEAAALDVFEEEPLPADSALRAFPQCVFGSHNASNTGAGVVRASERAADNLLSGLGG